MTTTVGQLKDVGSLLGATDDLFLNRSLQREQVSRLTDRRALTLVVLNVDIFSLMEGPIVLGAGASTRYREILAGEREPLDEPPFSLDAFQ